jgi:glutathione peroxidase
MNGLFAALKQVFKLNSFTVLKKPANVPNPVNPGEIRFRMADGTETMLNSYFGKKLLIVNVASKCGYTPQYAALEKLYEEFENGLTIIGFPSNDFLGQEPGTEDEIVQFCQLNYGVKFPLAAKINVTGKEKHPLYQWLSESSQNGWNSREPVWNFTKYLLDESGRLIAVFAPQIKPDDERLQVFLRN